MTDPNYLPTHYYVLTAIPLILDLSLIQIYSVSFLHLLWGWDRHLAGMDVCDLLFIGQFFTRHSHYLFLPILPRPVY